MHVADVVVCGHTCAAKWAIRSEQENLSQHIKLPSRILAALLEQYVFLISLLHLSFSVSHSDGFIPVFLSHFFPLCFESCLAAVRTVLVAIRAFMPTKGEGAVGALDYSDDERRRLAAQSRQWSCKQCACTNLDALPAEGSIGARIVSLRSACE